MYLPRSPASGNRNAEDIKVGPLQLAVPWLIPLCIFAPFFVSFVVFIVYRYIKRCRSKPSVVMLEETPQLRKSIEVQVQNFLNKPKQAKIRRLERH
jgi:hypothetical protein